jgi:WD40 repeat protein
MVEPISTFAANEDHEMESPHDPFSQTVINNEFCFMQTLACHASSVRSIATHPKGDILMSGSIDMTNKIYLLDNMTGRYDFMREMKYHSGFVLSLVSL